MSTETNFVIHSWFSGASLTSKHDVQEFIEDREETLKRAKETLSMLAYMTEPKKYIDEDIDPRYWIQRELEEAIEDIECASWQLHCAERILEQWDIMHHENGGEIRDYDRMENMARISAEYGVPVKPDGAPYYYENEYDKRAYKNLTGHDWPIENNDTAK